MFKVGDLVKVRINRGNSDRFQGIILENDGTAYREPCVGHLYINAWVSLSQWNLKIEVPTWSMELLSKQAMVEMIKKVKLFDKLLPVIHYLHQRRIQELL